ncbi:MAG: prepilin-type N-terminal cleavage/methylation domain-containing protein [Opitutales bacterium]|nr:prepilin-type N-terminal cleavage/methylation domain-containing protein [Opitutales bacterium]
MFKFCRTVPSRSGFSLLEMVFAISLSGVIIVGIMSLVLIFSNNYIASQRYEMYDREKACYENFLKLSLRDYCASQSIDREVDARMLDDGIFWMTDDLHAFEYPRHQFIAGLCFQDGKLYFLWTASESPSLTERDFESFELFKNVHSVRLMVYDRDQNKWEKEIFNEETVRKFLNEGSICYLRVKLGNGTIFVPLFGI